MDGYNGWKNYPTWCVNLWLSNDEELYRATLELIGDTLVGIANDDNVSSEIWTVEQASRYRVADALKLWVRDELAPDAYEGASFVADLVGWALDHVDWSEIADAWIETASEQVEA